MQPENSDPAEFVRFLGTEKASAILRTPHGDLALPAMESALRAGFRICEYTLTIPGAYELIRENGFPVSGGSYRCRNRPE